MFLPIRTDSPLRGTPYMNWALIVANVAMFVLQSFRPPVTSHLQLYPSDPWLPAFFSYAFLHADWAHVLMNMLFLFIFGNNVNDKMGHLGYLAFYLAGAVFSGVGYAVTQQGSFPVVGASGAVAAVTGAYLVLFPRSSITIVYLFIFIGSIEIPSFWFILFFFVKDLLGLSGAGSNVAHNAHISGTLFGFTVCLALLGAQLLPRDQFDVLALIQRWNKRRQYRDLVNKGYNPFGYTPVAAGAGRDAPASRAPEPPDPVTQRAMDLRGDIA